PGTLIVVSHDRYLIERVTDQQFAVMSGRLRHLPGGIDEYLRLGADASGTSADSGRGPQAPSESEKVGRPALSGAALRSAQKELASLERRIDRLQREAADARAALAELDQTD